MAYVDQGYTGPNAAEAAQQHGLRLEVVKHPMAKRGFLLLPRRWVVERSFAWAARFRRLARDYERLDTTLKGLHLLAFATLMLRNLADTLKLKFLTGSRQNDPRPTPCHGKSTAVNLLYSATGCLGARR
jgi:hypothetical protein